MSIRKIIEKKVPIYVWLYECQLNNIDINYFINKIDNNLCDKASYATNVKGGMTDWKLFNKDPKFHEIILESQRVLKVGQKVQIIDSWGIKVENGGHTSIHNHEPSWGSGIFYLTDSNTPLYFPDLDIEIETKKGTFLIWSGILNHGTERLKDETKYAIAFNLSQVKSWDNNKNIKS